jgi:D-alanyl-lipoteichoic acid acyltransferase DltB (MBOAT superfamily)
VVSAEPRAEPEASEVKDKLASHEQRQRRRVTLAQYIRRRNGVPAGSSGSLRNMLRRALGAGSFAGFWRYWNPVFGYYLGRYVYRPLQRTMPRALALVLTFVVCGALHDLVTMAVRGSVALFFTPWFFLLGTGVVVGSWLRLDFSSCRRMVRIGINLTYIIGCLAVTLAAKQIFVLY